MAGGPLGAARRAFDAARVSDPTQL